MFNLTVRRNTIYLGGCEISVCIFCLVRAAYAVCVLERCRQCDSSISYVQITVGLGAKCIITKCSMNHVI